MEQTQNSSLFQLNLDAQNSYTLRSAASWAKVLGVVGLIMGIIFIVSGIINQQRYSEAGYYRGNSGVNALATAGLVVTVIIGLIMIITSIFALNAGNKINIGLRGNDQATLNAGFAAIRNYFAFWAVILIICLLLIILGILGNV